MFGAQHKTYTTSRIDLLSGTNFFSSGDNSYRRSQYRKIAQTAIKTQLTENQAETVNLYFFEGLNVYQIAQVHGVHPSTVSRRLSRSIERIRTFASGCMSCLPNTPDTD